MYTFYGYWTFIWIRKKVYFFLLIITKRKFLTIINGEVYNDPQIAIHYVLDVDDFFIFFLQNKAIRFLLEIFID